MEAISSSGVSQKGMQVKARRKWEAPGWVRKVVILIVITIGVPLYLNIGYVVATDITRLCQNMKANSFLAEKFWMSNNAISAFCLQNGQPHNLAEFALFEVAWPLIYFWGLGHWLIFFLFKGGIAKMMGFAVFK